MGRLGGTVFRLALAAVALWAATGDATRMGPEAPGISWIAWRAPTFVPLDLHPVDQTYSPGAKPIVVAMPKIVRQGVERMPDQRQIKVPIVVGPGRPEAPEAMAPVGKSGTGFFIGHDGTLLTAAHVATECRRLQVLSRDLTRTWASLVALDRGQDIALLKATGATPPAVLRIAGGAPVSETLLVLGYASSNTRTAPAAVWVGLENRKFPASIGPLADAKALLWMSAPEVSHGFSGGPIFDPRLGAVVGLIKGEVDGGYLRLVRNMPTTGVAIGPGVGSIGAFLRREVGSVASVPAAPSGEAGEETVRRATVRVLCWQ